jgi:HD-like signal output (HDOD) protein/prolyl-tRNA editing enzyme YbaK/EbsC (Cys-tRNA(Pro) deacylase)
MRLPEAIRQYLLGAGVAYQIVDHPPVSRIYQAAQFFAADGSRVARAVLLAGAQDLQLAVLPLDRRLDFDRLQAQLGFAVDLAEPALIARAFPGCFPGTTPALGKAYSVPTVVDAALDQSAEVYLPVGRHDCLVKVSGKDFAKLYAGCSRGSFSRPAASADAPASDESAHENPYLAADEVPASLANLYAMPVLPDVALRVLQLKRDPGATVERLAQLVEADPALAAQVLRYARSSLFGYRGAIDTIHDAVHRVLGFDVVVGLAVGLAVARPFRLPLGGPLGLQAFWRHGIYSAVLAQQLARHVRRPAAPQPGLAYLAGLLHNFGMLVMGDLFPPEFAMLNRLVAANPGVPVRHIERQMLTMGESGRLAAVGHARLGAWLMHRWAMPPEVVVAQAEHHNEAYRGEYGVYPALVLVGDRMLRRVGLGDGDSSDLPAELLLWLGLDEDLITDVFARVVERSEGLDAMAASIAA